MKNAYSWVRHGAAFYSLYIVCRGTISKSSDVPYDPINDVTQLSQSFDKETSRQRAQFHLLGVCSVCSKWMPRKGNILSPTF